MVLLMLVETRLVATTLVKKLLNHISIKPSVETKIVETMLFETTLLVIEKYVKKV
jgi:hypothetical protein